MTERERFVDAHLQGDCSIAELCRASELVDRSRRPRSSPPDSSELDSGPCCCEGLIQMDG